MTSILRASCDEGAAEDDDEPAGAGDDAEELELPLPKKDICVECNQRWLVKQSCHCPPFCDNLQSAKDQASLHLAWSCLPSFRLFRTPTTSLKQPQPQHTSTSTSSAQLQDMADGMSLHASIRPRPSSSPRSSCPRPASPSPSGPQTSCS